MERTLKYKDPYKAKESSEYKFETAPTITGGITDPDAVQLWKTVMRTVKKTGGGMPVKVLDMPVTASSLLAKKITQFMKDENHIYYAFDGKAPKAKDIYGGARFSKSTWGRIMSGELLDIERGNVFAIALALRLNAEQTAELLHAAGFALNYEIELDAAVMYFINNEVYDLDKIWRILGEFCDIKNGLDCFVFHPRNDKQKPDRLKKKP